MKKIFLLNIVLLTVILVFSAAYAGPISIDTNDVPNSELSDGTYINNPLFAPYFNPTSTTIIDFEGPWSPPDTINDYFNLGAVGSTYNSIGINFGVDDTFMGGHSGFGYVTPNTVVGNSVWPYDGPINIYVVIPGTNLPGTVTSIGVFVADGPTNETTAWFYDSNNNLLGSVSADPNSNNFLGWSDPIGISRVEFTNGNRDDYFIDNLTFNTPIGTPLADLIITRINNIPNHKKRGGKFTIKDIVKNQGATEAGQFTNGYYLSIDTVKSDDDIEIEGSRNIASLDPGKSSSKNKGIKPVKVKIPSDAPLDDYYVIVCADNTNVIAESDETNNCLASKKTITVHK